MKALTIVVVATICCGGCITKPMIESTKPWEGHYYDVDSLRKNVDIIQLDENESVWIMSNHTLSRLIKNASGK